MKIYYCLYCLATFNIFVNVSGLQEPCTSLNSSSTISLFKSSFPLSHLSLCSFLLEENSQNTQPSLCLLCHPFSSKTSSSSSSTSLVTSIKVSQPLPCFKSSTSFAGLTLSSTFLSHLGLLLFFLLISCTLLVCSPQDRHALYLLI